MNRQHSGAIAAVVAVLLMGPASSARAGGEWIERWDGYTAYYGGAYMSLFHAWSEAVRYVSSIWFTELPFATYLSDQYQHLGVDFVAPDTVQVAYGWLIDYGHGPDDGSMRSYGGYVWLTFDAPINAIAVHSKQRIRFRCYRDGQLVVSTIGLSGGAAVMGFRGIIADELFDTVRIENELDPVLNCDNIHFATVPTDCNGNGIPDAPEVGEGLAPDCNANGMPDECDIASGVSLDRDGDGVPDECNDCTGSGQMDWMDIAAGLAADCNGNGIPDQCDIAGGWSADCDGNGVPDECEISYPRSGESPVWGPPAANQWYVHTLWDVGRAGTDVTLTFTAHGDLDTPLEWLDVHLNTVLLGRAFTDWSADCTEVTDTFVIPRDTWNDLVENDGWDRAWIWLKPSGAVNGAQCPDGFLRWTATWQSEGTGDLDTNGIVDACEALACPADLDGSGHVEFADLLSLLSVFGPCEAPCPADFDGNGAVDFMDLLLLLAAWGPCR